MKELQFREDPAFRSISWSWLDRTVRDTVVGYTGAMLCGIGAVAAYQGHRTVAGMFLGASALWLGLLWESRRG